MITRCKMKCTVKEDHGGSDHIKLDVVYNDGSSENGEFFKYTPAGNMEFWSVNPEATKQIEVGKEYYIDISSVH